MKIGYILKIFPKISEKFVTNEILELIKMGHEIYIFSIFHPNEKIINREKVVHSEISEYNLLRSTFYPPHIQRSVLELSGYSKLFLTQNIYVQKLHDNLCIDVANYFAKVIEDNDIKLDVIHAHFATEPTYVAYKMSKILNIPFTFMAHAFDIFINPDIKSLKEKIENASAIMTPSYYNKEYLSNLISGIDKNKIFVVRACPNIDELKLLGDRYRYRYRDRDRNRDKDKNNENDKNENNENDKNENNEFNILSISRLVEKKGIKYGILAIKELIREYPEINYNIIGSGPLERNLKKLIRTLEIENNVKIIQNLDNNALMTEFNKATIFILPCIKAKNGDMDGIPVSLMESMYLQIPTISTKISGIPELIENNIDGLLVEDKNVGQLVESLKILYINKDLRIKIGNNGKDKVENNFNIHKEAKKLIEIWKNNKNGIKD